MVGASKILTVSYGTFSCTLEGFDDPFSTMKAIAEYFRDLAADDRYFGAEPPQPDAAMLSRIAEREIQRRVEAKIGQNAIVLRPEPREAPLSDEARGAILHGVPGARAEDLSPLPEVYEEDEETGVAEGLATGMAQAEPAYAAPQATLAPVVAPAFEPEPAAEPADAAAESVAAKLLRIRAAVAGARAAEEAETAAYAEDADLDAAEAAMPAPGAQGDDWMAAEDTTEPGEDVVAGDAVSAADESQAAEAAAEVGPDIEIAPEEADHDALTAIQAALVADAVEDAEEDDEDEDEDDDLYAEFEELPEIAEAEAPAEEPVAEAVEEAALPELAAAPEGEDTLRADTIAAILAEEEALAPPPAAEEAPRRVRARVIKVRRIDVPRPEAEPDADLAEAALLRSVSAQVEAEAPVAAPAVETAPVAGAEPEMLGDPLEDTLGDTGLSDEEEAELLAELAEVEREAAATRRAAGEPAETEVARLMREAETQEDAPDARRRHATIAHLKAAVAATEADRGNAAEAPAERHIDRFRDDLARVVRPRRPERPDGGRGPRRVTPAAAPERPAPLVLVSEQRIDRTKPAPGSAPAAPPLTAVPSAPAAPAAPVAPTRVDPATIRPRRIATATLVDEAEPDLDEELDEVETGDANLFAETSFADFAEQVGATRLPDLLEAAAAYSACVQGRPHFTRPHLMRFADSLSGGEDPSISREDRMRGFGTLLRMGRIQKVRRGQYAISETSRYLVEARKLSD